MRRVFLSLGLLLLFLPNGCQNKDEQIQTYRISKEPGPRMPMADAPMTPSSPGPAMGGDAGGPAGAGMPSMGAGSNDIQWDVPAGWQVQAPSAMRIGSFLAKGSDGRQADISVVPLSGDAGGDLANINRWRGQINLDPISEADLPRNSQTIAPGGRSMLLVDFVSREPLVENRFPKRLIAAIYKPGGRSWFFKMTGEDKTVQEVKPAFLQFLKSLRFHGND